MLGPADTVDGVMAAPGTGLDLLDQPDAAEKAERLVDRLARVPDLISEPGRVQFERFVAVVGQQRPEDGAETLWRLLVTDICRFLKYRRGLDSTPR